jgi:hypothetical protein
VDCPDGTEGLFGLDDLLGAAPWPQEHYLRSMSVRSYVRSVPCCCDLKISSLLRRFCYELTNHCQSHLHIPVHEQLQTNYLYCLIDKNLYVLNAVFAKFLVVCACAKVRKRPIPEIEMRTNDTINMQQKRREASFR